MAPHEFGGLYEHAARAAAWVVDATVIGFDDLDQCSYDAGGRVELAGVLALGLGELGQAVLVGASQDIAGVALLGHLNVGKQVDHFAQTTLVELLAGKVLGQDIL